MQSVHIQTQSKVYFQLFIPLQKPTADKQKLTWQRLIFHSEFLSVSEQVLSGSESNIEGGYHGDPDELQV